MSTEHDTLSVAVGAGESSVTELIRKRGENPHVDDPTLYGRVFNPLPAFVSSNVGSIFADHRANHLKPLYRQEALLTLPGLTSFDPESIGHLREFSDLADREVKADIDDELFSRNGLHTNMQSLKTVAGYEQIPISAVPRRNHRFITEELGLKGQMTGRQKEIFTSLWRLVFSTFKPSAVNIPRISQSGPRRRTTDHVWKEHYLLALLNPRRLERFLSTVEGGDYESLANDFECAILMYMQKRTQVDKPGKVRTSFRLSSVWAEEEPSTVETVKDVYIHGRHVEGFNAMRVRTVHAGPWSVNALLQVIATGHLYGLFDRFPLTCT
jgi:hypothetical protein